MTDAGARERSKRTEEAAGRAVRIALEVPAEEVRESIELLERQEATLPFLDPTAWMRGGGKVTGVALAMMRAFLKFREELDRIRGEAGPEFYREWLEFGVRVKGGTP